MQEQYKSGFVTLIGRSNVGKSTLVNAMVGEKVAIVSDRPQTTRNQIRGVLHRPDYQIVFIDTPGLHRPHNRLGQYMVRSAGAALEDVDVVLAVIDASVPVGGGDRAVMDRLKTLKDTPVILLLNKIDLVPKTALLKTIEIFSEYDFIRDILPISARTFEGVSQLEAMIVSHLKPGPKYFPEDMYTDQPERVIVSEVVREKALSLLREEIPHGIGVEVVQMKKRSDSELVDIHADIIVERENHKGIVVGKKGEMLKKIGSRARVELESLLGSPINLQLWVKARDNWRDSANVLRDLGYDEKNDI
jgi:GTP-binding protein Era